jgi:hypothetical protein
MIHEQEERDIPAALFLLVIGPPSGANPHGCLDGAQIRRVRDHRSRLGERG